MTDKKLDLYFRPGDMKGFTASGIQRFSELNPACVVRELIQNSLDAARDAKNEKAIVHFELESRPLTDVPAIESYRRHVQSAIRDQSKRSNGKLKAKDKIVVNTINQCLAKDHIEFISILDNGLGLNQRRMESLLSDGVHDKETETSTGTVGNGHFSAIPASDLRYILYGGISEGRRVASGHAVLASFEQNGSITGNDGYYVEGFGLFDKLFDFPSGDGIEKVISEKLDWIEGNSKSGAAVIIPGFNRFRDGDADLWNTIQEAAACNFLVAITDGHLEITYKDHIDCKERSLNKSNIKNVFEGELASKQRAKDSLPGKWAAEGYRTITEETTKPVDTEFGKVEVLVRKETTFSRPRIDLFRNGMWITNRVPNLEPSKFNDREPFHCLIKVSADDSMIHQLIRTSEGSLHNSIERSELSKDEWAKLRSAFGEISKFLEKNVEKLEQEEFFANNVLSVEGISFEDVPPRGFRTLPISKRKIRRPSPRPPIPPKPDPSPSPGSRTVNSFIGNSIAFRANLRPTGPRSCSAELHPDPREKLDEGVNAEIRFVLDENFDYTSTGLNDEQFVKLKRDSVELNEKAALDSELVKNEENGAIEGVLLGQFKAGTKLSFDYDLPDGVETQEINDEVLRAYIVLRQDQS